MEEIKNPSTEIKSDNFFEKENLQLSTQPIPQKNILPTITSFLLIIAGVFAIINWVSIFLLDINTLNIYYDISQLQKVYPNITSEQFLDFLKTCAAIGIVISIFPILGGVSALKRKMWGVTVACSIIGLLSIGILFTSSLFSFVAIIMLFVSKKQFQ